MRQEFAAKPRFAWLVIPICQFIFLIVLVYFLIKNSRLLETQALVVLWLFSVLTGISLFLATDMPRKIFVDDNSITFYSLRRKNRIPFSSIIGLKRRSAKVRYSGITCVINYRKNNKIRKVYFSYRFIQDFPILIRILRDKLRNIPQTKTMKGIFRIKEENWPSHEIP